MGACAALAGAQLAAGEGAEQEGGGGAVSSTHTHALPRTHPPTRTPTRTRAPPRQELGGGPPTPFTLTESKGDTLLTLTRAYGNEEVRVDVQCNDQARVPSGGGAASGGASALPRPPTHPL